MINGETLIKLTPELRGLGERYEPEVWKQLLNACKKGDIIADVGAHVGLYTVAMAQKVTSSGRVYAFEPSPATFAILRRNISINGQAGVIEAFQKAVGNVDRRLYFDSSFDSEAHVLPDNSLGTEVECVRLDTVFAGKRLDVLKIDVEGYELEVLRGAQSLLSDKLHCPRCIFIEVHPYAWTPAVETCRELFSLLERHGYRVSGMDGATLSEIKEYGEIVATSPEAIARTKEPAWRWEAGNE